MSVTAVDFVPRCRRERKSGGGTRASQGRLYELKFEGTLNGVDAVHDIERKFNVNIFLGKGCAHVFIGSDDRVCIDSIAKEIGKLVV